MFGFVMFLFAIDLLSPEYYRSAVGNCVEGFLEREMESMFTIGQEEGRSRS